MKVCSNSVEVIFVVAIVEPEHWTIHTFSMQDVQNCTKFLFLIHDSRLVLIEE